MAVIGDGGASAVAAAVTVAEAVDVDALQLLADVGQLGVGTVRRGLGPAGNKGNWVNLSIYGYFPLQKKCECLLGSNCIPFTQSSRN